MIIIQSEKDIERVSAHIQAFIKFWWDRLNDDDPQIDIYSSDFPIGSLGEVRIIENQEEVKDKDFIEVIQINLKDMIVFVGIWVPIDGSPCADIFIPSNILSENLFNQFISQADEVRDF